MKFGTKVIHAGIHPDSTTGAIMTPIFQTSTYTQKSLGQNKGYIYARGANPTRTVLQNSLAALENGSYGISFSSGMGATDAVMKLLKPGDEVITEHHLYGGSYRMYSQIFSPYGIGFHYVDLTEPENILKKITPQTKLVWFETPSNPMMQVIDIAACVRIAKDHNLLTVVDNTFASPYLQNPLDLGADIVMHSVTKYLGGHSDIIMGALITRQKELADRLMYIANVCGAIPGPQDCFLALRGIKTLHIRMERHCFNASQVAHFLRNHKAVQHVYWPGFYDHPHHAVAKKQMKNFGGIVSFRLHKDQLDSVTSILEKVKLFSLAESLGGVESLINHPSTMTHASVPAEIRQKIGITDSLMRLSVGIEDIEDILVDLDQALS